MENPAPSKGRGFLVLGRQTYRFSFQEPSFPIMESLRRGKTTPRDDCVVTRASRQEQCDQTASSLGALTSTHADFCEVTSWTAKTQDGGGLNPYKSTCPKMLSYGGVPSPVGGVAAGGSAGDKERTEEYVEEMQK